MTKIRSPRIESIFHEALALSSERQTEFLAEACQGDESLYQEVASLLSHYQSAGGFLENDAVPLLNSDPELAAPAFKEGDQIGPYEIIHCLGEGGMGEVYLARHPRLGSKVALKILSKHLAASPDLIERFKREAKAASALNHPNILTILDFEQQGDLQYIVSEFVEGVSLREHIGQLSTEEALNYARQIAEALKAAHAAGIVHRDIKPENIMVRPDGYIKVLDFGLAKLTNPPLEARKSLHQAFLEDGQRTLPGMLIGTINYMSPEQVRGEDSDQRTDVWSWAVVLYEMIAVRRPFDGPTPSDVLAAILKQEPPPCTSNRGLTKLLCQALSKRREDRYQSMQDVLDTLTSVRLHTATIRNYLSKTTHKGTDDPFAQIRLAALLLVVLLLSGAGVYIYKNYQNSHRRPFHVVSSIALTSSGQVRQTAISPDGKTIAYTTQESRGQALRIQQADSNSNGKLIHTTSGEYTGITFSPEGQSLYYVLRQNEVGKLYVMSLPDGNSKMVLDNVDSAISFSPDGRKFAFQRINSLNHQAWLIVKGLEISPENNVVTLTAPDYFWTAPIWSPDGCCLLFGALNDSGIGVTNIKLMSVDLKGGQEKVIGPGPWYWIGRPVWPGSGRDIVLSVNEIHSNLAQIMDVSWPEGKISAITHDGNSYGNLDSDRNREQMVTVQNVRHSQPWIISLHEPQRARLVPSLDGTFYGIEWTKSGHIISQTDAGGSPDLWEIEPATGVHHQLTHDTSVEEDPAASPDGQYVVYASNREGGSFHLWRSNRDGSNPIRLTSDSSREEEDIITPDSQWVIYTSIREGYPALWRVSINGGKALQLTDHSARKPAISPDGHFIACQYVQDSKQGWITAVLDASTGHPLNFFSDIPARGDAPPIHWSADGNLLYVVTSQGISNIWEQPARGGISRQLTHFTSERIFAFAISPDGRSVAGIKGTVTSNAVMVQLAK